MKKQNQNNILKIRYKPDFRQGLSIEEVTKQKENGSQNITKDETSKSYGKIIIGNLFTFFNILMFSIAALFFIAKGLVAITNVFFLIIILANILIGTIQECKSKRIIEKLKLINNGKITVIREGKEFELLPYEIVLDDIIKLKIGDQIPADCIVLNGHIETNESLLTGESDAIKKDVGDFLYGGSFVVSGDCYARVDKVAYDTYIYSIESKAKNFVPPKSKLMSAITGIIKILTPIVIILGILTFWVSLQNNFASNGEVLNWEIVSDAIISGGSSMVGMVPCGMILLASVAMATGVIKLAKRNTLIQNLYSVESLARVDTLCFDKTGTLTDGTMTVEEVIQFDIGVDLKELIGSYLNSFESTNQTSDALLKKYDKSTKYLPKNTLPFSSIRKYSAVEFEDGETYALGAPEFLIKDEEILRVSSEKALNGLRTLLLCKLGRGLRDGEDAISKRRTPIALFIIRDNIRPEVKEITSWFNDNDVEIRVISGDNPDTVSYIAKQSGINNWDKAVDFSKIDESELEKIVMENYVFGRVTPEQKALIVDILHKNNRTVAITGDGVNDVLAMKKADCSVAMANGSPATRNVANVVLLDSDFSNMPRTVMEGRRVVNNIQRSATLFLMKVFFVMFLSLTCVFMNLNYPLEASSMTLLSTFITGIGSLLLSIEPSYNRITGNFKKNVLGKSIPAGFFMFLPIMFMIVYSFVVNRTLSTTIVNQALQVSRPVLILLLNISAFVIYYKICTPFSKYRKVLYFTTLVFSLFLLLLIPEFFLRGGTKFMESLLVAKDFPEMLQLLGNKFFNFDLYRAFTAGEWTVITVFTLLSFIIYYIADKVIAKVLKIKMFSSIMEDEE